MGLATSISEIFCSGTVVQIETVNNFGNKLIINTTVYRLDDQNLILNLPEQTGVFNQVNLDVDVKVVYKQSEESRDYVFLTKFIMVKEADQPLLFLSKPLDISMGQHAVRYNVNLPFSYFINDKEIKGGAVIDLSCFGLLAAIKPDDSLEIGLGVLLKLVIPTSPSLLLFMGTIVRLLKQKNEYHVAVDFSHIPIETQDQITKYLFSIQNSSVNKEQPAKATFIKIK